jgi:carbon monoxide dehydrogenase subunit G
MTIVHDFVIDRPLDDVWRVVTDLPSVARAIPGARVEDAESDGTYQGSLKLKLGAIGASFRGTARYEEIDPDARTFVLEGSGNSAQGGASLRVEGSLAPGQDGTAVTLTSSVRLTGQLGQFGGGMADDVVTRLLDAFVANLASGFTDTDPAGGGPTSHPPGAPAATDAGGGAWQGVSADALSLTPRLPPLAMVAAGGAAVVALFAVGVLVGRASRKAAPTIYVVPFGQNL